MNQTKRALVAILAISLAFLLVIQISFNRLALTSTIEKVNLVTETRDETPPDPLSRAFRSYCYRCNIHLPMRAVAFKAQSGEDRHLLNNFFKGICNGTYVEVGGLDGVLLSNTFAFNKKLGWKGVLIEGNPDFVERLKINRPNELLTLHAAVCSIPQTVHYVSRGSVGGIYELASPVFRKKWWDDIDIEKNTTKLPCLPLGQILKDYVPTHNFFDFWSLDVEGAELEVLHSVNFTEVAFGVILIEIGRGQPIKAMSIRTFLSKQGYVHLDDALRSAWFINKDFANIYSHVREG